MLSSALFGYHDSRCDISLTEKGGREGRKRTRVDPNDFRKLYSPSLACFACIVVRIYTESQSRMKRTQREVVESSPGKPQILCVVVGLKMWGICQKQTV